MELVMRNPGSMMASGAHGPARAGRRRGFTLLELMISIFIFALVMTAIYTIWISILRGTQAALAAAAEVQRSRIAMQTIEDALTTAIMHLENLRFYGFVADTSGDYAALSLVSRLPGSFPGVGYYAGGALRVRRVSFFVEPDPTDVEELVMTQAPILLDPDALDAEPYRLALARDVTEFKLEFWDLRKEEWVDEWRWTNQLPKLVRVTLGLGRKGDNPHKAHDVVSRVIALPSVPVAGLQGGLAPVPRAPGVVPPGAVPPGAVPPGGVPPGRRGPGIRTPLSRPR